MQNRDIHRNQQAEEIKKHNGKLKNGYGDTGKIKRFQMVEGRICG